MRSNLIVCSSQSRHAAGRRRSAARDIASGFVAVPAACLLLVGCATPSTGPDPFEIEPPAFSGSGDARSPADWWTTFEDDDLNEFVRTALDGNFDLAAARERLRAADALARRERSDLFPDLDGFLGAESNRADAGERGGGSDFVDAGLAASYEVDLWGRIRATAEAEALRAEATAADLEAAKISLAGEVALTWYRLVEQKASLDLLAAQLEANEKVLTSLTNRFRGGQVRSVDILRQEQLLEATRERLIAAESDYEVLKHQLAVLLGRPPQPPEVLPAGGLPELAPLPATGLPAEIVRRRPDIRAAFLRLRAAARDLAAAVSARYPRLNLTAGLTTSSEDAADLFDDWARSIAAELIGPIIDGGQRRAEAERTRAVRRQRLAEYSQTTREAFREIEDALAREAKQRERIASLREQVRLQSTAYDRLQSEFFNGISDFIDVLTALTGTQQLRRDLLVAERQLIEFRIALYRALAGPIDDVPTSVEKPRPAEKPRLVEKPR